MLAAVLFKPNKNWGMMFGFLLGLSACTHMLFIGGVVFASVLLFNRRREVLQIFPWLCSGLFLGISLYLWIPLRAHLSPSINWGEPAKFSSLWYYLTQQQFAEKMFSRNVAGIWVFFVELTRIFLSEWNPLAWLLGGLGAIIAWPNQRNKILALLAVMVFNIGELFVGLLQKLWVKCWFKSPQTLSPQ
jgi:hypothetical protein